MLFSIKNGADASGASLTSMPSSEQTHGLSIQIASSYASLKVEPQQEKDLKLYTGRKATEIDSVLLVPRIALTTPSECKIDIDISTKVEEILHSTEKAKHLHIDIAKKVFVSKLCNLLSVGALSLIQISQFYNIKEEEKINTGTATVSLIALGVATADSVAALADYLTKKKGGEGLTMGANSIAGIVRWVSKICGVSQNTSQRSANIISTSVRTGLMITQLLQNFGKLTVQNFNKVVALPKDIVDFASGLSGNISDVVVRQIPWTKISLESVSSIAFGIAKGKEREAYELAGNQQEQKYRLNSKDVVKANTILATLSSIGKAVALASGACVPQKVSIVLNVIYGAGKAMEGQAKLIGGLPLINKFV